MARLAADCKGLCATLPIGSIAISDRPYGRGLRLRQTAFTDGLTVGLVGLHLSSVGGHDGGEVEGCFLHDGIMAWIGVFCKGGCDTLPIGTGARGGSTGVLPLVSVEAYIGGAPFLLRFAKLSLCFIKASGFGI